ncbi:MAG: hypothetical protein IPL01_03215 [Acidobacteria bacterium]|nr:hypothetical protein [Acidobacteriota bacterium]
MRSRTSAKSFSLAVMITVAIAMGACSSGQPSQQQLNANASPTPAADFATPPQTQIGGTTAPQQSGAPGQALAPGATQSQPQPAGSGGQSNSAPPPSGSTASNMAPRPVATPAPPRVYTIPSGTVISVTTSSDLTTKEDRSGQKFTASLNNSIVDGDWVIAKKGAPVEGVIVTSDPGGKVKGTASISVRVERLTSRMAGRSSFQRIHTLKQRKRPKRKMQLRSASVRVSAQPLAQSPAEARARLSVRAQAEQPEPATCWAQRETRLSSPQKAI